MSVATLYNGKISSNKTKLVIANISSNMNRPQKSCLVKETNHRKPILHDSISTECPEWAHPETEGRPMVTTVT